MNPRDEHSRTNLAGYTRNVASANNIYNQRLETYYFQSVAARSCKTLVPMLKDDRTLLTLPKRMTIK